MTASMRFRLLVNALLALVAACFLVCSNGPTAGGETVNERTCALYMPDGVTPAVDAAVSVLAPNDTTRTALYETTTDSKGNYTLSGQGLDGKYNVWFALDTLVAYQDSVIISPSQKTVSVDTLENSASLSAVVRMQPGHTPRSVTVQALGTYLYTNVSDNGWFTLKGLAAGEYGIRMTTSLPDYVDTFFTVSIAPMAVDTIPDTLWLPYIGIPAVIGLSATYDTLNGAVHLSWLGVQYHDLQDYLIYRAWYDSIRWPTSPLAMCQDTSFVDSVFRRGTATGPFSFGDSNDYHFKYRITARNNADIEGLPYGYVAIVAASPAKVKTVFSSTKWHMVKEFFTDSCSVNDSMRIAVELSNSTRAIVCVIWRDVATGDTLRMRTLGGSLHERDSLIAIWESLGMKRIECVAIDQAGSVWQDTVGVLVVEDVPSVRIIADSVIYVGIPWTLHIDAEDKYGKIKKIEWDIGGTGEYTLATVQDTVITIDNMQMTEFTCSVRAFNDDGKSSSIAADFPVGISWARLAGAPDSNFACHGVAAFDSNLVLFVHSPRGQGYRFGMHFGVLRSQNGMQWNWAVDSGPWKTWISEPAVFKNRIWLIEAASDSTRKVAVWSSTNGQDWISSEPTPFLKWFPVPASLPQTERFLHEPALFVFGNKLWAAIDNFELQPNEYELYSSDDGTLWIPSKLTFEPLRYSDQDTRGQPLRFCSDSSKAWFIGGKCDRATVLSSSDFELFSTAAILPTVTASGDCRVPRPVKYLGSIVLCSSQETLYGGYSAFIGSDGLVSKGMPYPGSREHLPVVFRNRLYSISDNGVWLAK